MKRFIRDYWALVLAAALAAAALVWQVQSAEILRIPDTAEAEIAFNAECSALWVKEIDAAREGEEIRILDYDFNSQPEVDAIKRAALRHVKVRFVSDRRMTLNRRAVQWKELAAEGCELWFDGRHDILHHKVLIRYVPGNTTRNAYITGSYNPTEHARKRNAENAQAVRSFPAGAKVYWDEWDRHRDHADKWKP